MDDSRSLKNMEVQYTHLKQDSWWVKCTYETMRYYDPSSEVCNFTTGHITHDRYQHI